MKVSDSPGRRAIQRGLDGKPTTKAGALIAAFLLDHAPETLTCPGDIHVPCPGTHKHIVEGHCGCEVVPR
jgi:hypothetical protein